MEEVACGTHAPLGHHVDDGGTVTASLMQSGSTPHAATRSSIHVKGIGPGLEQAQKSATSAAERSRGELPEVEAGGLHGFVLGDPWPRDGGCSEP
jgi:hypothetical protein